MPGRVITKKIFLFGIYVIFGRYIIIYNFNARPRKLYLDLRPCRYASKSFLLPKIQETFKISGISSFLYGLFEWLLVFNILLSFTRLTFFELFVRSGSKSLESLLETYPEIIYQLTKYNFSKSKFVMIFIF